MNQLSASEADIDLRFVDAVIEHSGQAERWEFTRSFERTPFDHVEFSVRELLTNRSDYDPQEPLLHSIRLCSDPVSVDQPLTFGQRIPRERLLNDAAVEHFLGGLHLADHGDRLSGFISDYSPPAYAHRYAATVLLDRIEELEEMGLLVPAHLQRLPA